MKKLGKVLQPEKEAYLIVSSLKEWRDDTSVLNYGTIMICRKGSATMCVNFKEWQLFEGAVITLFPNDVVILKDVSDDFSVEMLKYDASLLREASLQLEQTVYQSLREDRCRTESTIVTDIINQMFSLLKIYFIQEDCTCLSQLVLLQLKAFFLGFYDYLYRHPAERPEETGSRRTHEIFNEFMMLVEHQYKESRDVNYYADVLHITPKYLNTIVRRVTKNTPKTIIDHYAILQLKLELQTSGKSVKQIAWEYHFSDVSFFCRYFKVHTGVTPQQMRK
jgi:AraC-like DNA-binding protein